MAGQSQDGLDPSRPIPPPEKLSQELDRTTVPGQLEQENHIDHDHDDDLAGRHPGRDRDPKRFGNPAGAGVEHREPACLRVGGQGVGFPQSPPAQSSVRTGDAFLGWSRRLRERSREPAAAARAVVRSTQRRGAHRASAGCGGVDAHSRRRLTRACGCPVKPHCWAKSSSRLLVTTLVLHLGVAEKPPSGSGRRRASLTTTP